MNLVRWFRQAWPFEHGRRAVLAEYASLRHKPLLLADIGLRGGVWGVPPPPRDLFQAGVNEGRRQMALELIKIAKADPMVLFGFVPEKPKPGAET